MKQQVTKRLPAKKSTSANIKNVLSIQEMVAITMS
jgi:hypothetical protein